VTHSATCPLCLQAPNEATDSVTGSLLLPTRLSQQNTPGAAVTTLSVSSHSLSGVTRVDREASAQPAAAAAEKAAALATAAAALFSSVDTTTAGSSSSGGQQCVPEQQVGAASPVAPIRTGSVRDIVRSLSSSTGRTSSRGCAAAVGPSPRKHAIGALVSSRLQLFEPGLGSSSSSSSSSRSSSSSSSPSHRLSSNLTMARATTQHDASSNADVVGISNSSSSGGSGICECQSNRHRRLQGSCDRRDDLGSRAMTGQSSSAAEAAVNVCAAFDAAAQQHGDLDDSGISTSGVDANAGTGLIALHCQLLSFNESKQQETEVQLRLPRRMSLTMRL